MQGSLNAAQRAIVAQHVAGMCVVDVGAGDFSLSVEMVSLGATEVVAVEPKPWHRPTPANVRHVRLYLDAFHETHSVGFVSWPINNLYLESALIRFAMRTDKLIVLAKTTDGLMCAGPTFWEYIMTREVLVYSADPVNTLVVYGPRYVRRPPKGVERGGISDDILSYESAEAV